MCICTYVCIGYVWCMYVYGELFMYVRTEHMCVCYHIAHMYVCTMGMLCMYICACVCIPGMHRWLPIIVCYYANIQLYDLFVVGSRGDLLGQWSQRWALSETIEIQLTVRHQYALPHREAFSRRGNRYDTAPH